MKIAIWSDVVCPFCYIGKKKLEGALARLGMSDSTTLEWHSFQLDPDLPSGTSIPTTGYLAQRKGLLEEEILDLYRDLEEAGRQYGIAFRFDRALTCNTYDLHRLIRWAGTQDMEGPLSEAFMKAHFTEGRDLSREEVILEVVQSVGLPTGPARAILRSDDWGKEVAADIYRFRLLGARGVPYFLIEERQIIAGAQDDAVFDQVLKGVLEASGSSPAVTGDGHCTTEKGACNT